MESQPQNPEFRNNPETFIHAVCVLNRGEKQDCVDTQSLYVHSN